MNLDSLIQFVREQQSKPEPGQGKPDPGQKKPPQPGEKQPGNNEGGTDAAQESTLQRIRHAFQSNSQDMNEKGREWGNLPGRDRDLIANSVKEASLPAYREMVDRYYQALAEIGKTTREK